MKNLLKTVTACLLAAFIISCGGGGGTETETTPGISGRVTIGGTYFAGVTVTLSGAASASTTTNTSGYYSFTGLADGDYVVTPTRTGCTFSPAASGTLTFSGTSITQNFTATITPAISAGENHSLALKSDGTVWAWGHNNYGQLGQGTTSTSINTPTQISTLSGIIAIAAGGNHSLVLRANGTVWAWGYNNYGQIGNGTTSTYINTPTQISSLSSIKAIAAGGNHSLALTNSGSVKAWGAGTSGQIGDGGSVNRYSPVNVNLTSTAITAIAAGGNHSLALTSGGGVKAWGAGTNGQIGDGSSVNRYSPVDVTLTSAVITAISAGGNHSLALTNSGSVKAWGAGTSGQIGDGGSVDRYSPVDVTLASAVITAISAGGNHSLALTNSGSVKAWGAGTSGQIGDGYTVDRYSPVDVTLASAVITAISAGGNHSLALTSSGSAKSWGYNNYGQLGRETTSTYGSTPGDVNSF